MSGKVKAKKPSKRGQSAGDNNTGTNAGTNTGNANATTNTHPPDGASLIASTTLPQLTKVQGFKAVTIDRRRIKNAPYNPRVLSPAQRRKLRRSLEKFKLVETLVWNVRTENLVGGHQRLSLIDDIEGTDAYSITVSQIDVDEATERALNVALNNPELQGQYDLELLSSVVTDILETSPKLVEDAGFDRANLHMLLGDEFLTPGAAQQAEAESPLVAELDAMYEAGTEADKARKGAAQSPDADADPAGNQADNADSDHPPDDAERYGEKGWTKQDFKDRRQEFRQQKNTLDQANVYLTLVFDDVDQVGELLERYGLNPNLRSVDASMFMGLFGVELASMSEGPDEADDEAADDSVNDLGEQPDNSDAELP